MADDPKDNPGSVFETMVREAMTEVANHGWKKASGKAVTLAAFGMMCEKITSKIDRLSKPAWVIGLSLASALIWLIISKLFGL